MNKWGGSPVLDLGAFAAEHFSFMNPSFAQMATPALLVARDHDKSRLSTRGPDWWTDASAQSPANKSLLTLFGAEHTMGAVAGYSTHETTDWSLQRIALIEQVTAAYLRRALNLEDEAWPQVHAALGNDPHPLGRLESK
jgi:hypothetical protein